MVLHEAGGNGWVHVLAPSQSQWHYSGDTLILNFSHNGSDTLETFLIVTAKFLIVMRDTTPPRASFLPSSKITNPRKLGIRNINCWVATALQLNVYYNETKHSEHTHRLYNATQILGYNRIQKP